MGVEPFFADIEDMVLACVAEVLEGDFAHHEIARILRKVEIDRRVIEGVELLVH